MIPVHNTVIVKSKKSITIASLVAVNPLGGFITSHSFESPVILQAGDSASIQWNFKVDAID